MALKDWIQKGENNEDPPAISANLAILPERRPENSHNSHNSHRVSPKIKHSNPVAYDQEQDPFDFMIGLAIKDLNKRHVSIMEYPAATRHKSLLLEEQMTEAANQGNREEFIKLLRQWRNCFN